MKQHKVMTVYGTRPEAIKVATVIEALERDERFESIAVVTGQHREMLDQVNSMFGITPKHDLDLMKPGQPLNGIVSRAIAGIDSLIEFEQPDIVIVQGDTSTAMAAAIAAFNRQVTVVHLEAGLRTGNIDSPFPEKRIAKSSARWRNCTLPRPSVPATISCANRLTPTRSSSPETR